MNITLHIDGKPVTLENVEHKGGEIAFAFNHTSYRFRCHGSILEKEHADGVLQRMTASVWQGKGARHVQLGAAEAFVTESLKVVSSAAGIAEISPCALMPGLVRQILVKKGDKVKHGQPLIVMEAMKLQTTLSAGGEGKVEAVLVKEGQLVAEGAELVKIK